MRGTGLGSIACTFHASPLLFLDARMHLSQTLSLIALGIALAGCSTTPSGGPPKDRTYRLTVLHTNDHHGHFWKNGDGEYGLAARKTLVTAAGSSLR